MKTAVHFLSEWAEGEAWKVYILNKVLAKSKTDSEQLLKDVLYLMKSREIPDKVSDVDRNDMEKQVLTIDEISSPRNINALSSDINFSLGKKLNVFYGENGSGKSSYVRMFRKFADNYFTSEKDLTIIPNVYMEQLTKKTMEQVVETTYSLGEQKKKEIVNINQRHNVLCKINIFDTDSIVPLINNDLSFSILPKGFENFQITSNLLDILRIETLKAINHMNESRDKIFIDSSHNFIREDIENILGNVKTTGKLKSYLESNYPKSDEYDEVIKEIDFQINELESSNPIDKIKILNAQKTKLFTIVKSIENLSVFLNQENLKKVNKLIVDFENKLIEEHKFNLSFKKRVSFLEVVNNEWLEFIKAGKHYFDSINKKQINLNEPCIFCSTPLNSTSATLIDSYMKQISNSNRETLNSIEKEIQNHDITNMIKLLVKEEEALFESEKFIEKIKSTMQLLNRNIDIFNTNLKAKKTIGAEVILDVTDVIETINTEFDALNNRIENLSKSKDETGKLIVSLKNSKLSVQKNEKLHTLTEQLEKWIFLQEEIERYKKIKGKFSTNTLTNKQAEAFKIIVQEEYIKTFEDFSKDLKVPNVDLKLIPKKGETLRKKFVASEKYKVTQIMSEGEQKAIAMVEFATDLTMRNDFNTILFDDPVTSLDYKRTESIVNLIYKLSKDRQILVFTHNIMFYYMLYNISEKTTNKENKFFKVDELDKMNKGLVSESFNGKLENLSRITKRLKDQKQSINSKKCYGDELEQLLKKAYSDIRTWCELIVEEGFLKKIIRRHEPNIMFSKVKDINGSFVNELEQVSDLFEKSCRWMAGHSQSVESQNSSASKESFNEDMEYILKISEQYKSN